MPGRKYSAGSGYRYGFNGKENDNDVKGEGDQQDYGMRVYDPRLGRFLSVDPLTNKYAYYTPYQFAGNKPIEAIDLDGAEEYYKNQMSRLKLDVQLKAITADNLKRAAEQKRVEDLYNNETILAADMYGNGHIGPRYVVKSNIAAIRQNYVDAVGDNIRGGPFGATGYLIGGDKGSFYGAVGDNIAFSFGGIQGESSIMSKPSFKAVPEDVTSLRTPDAASSERGGTIINSIKNRQTVDVLNGKFSQPNHSNSFSEDGQRILGVETIDQAVDNLKGGTWTSAKLPIDYVVRDGQAYYLNTRSIATLTEAGVPKSKWVFQNQTGVKRFENNLTNNLNGSSGYTEVTNRQTGKKTKLK